VFVVVIVFVVALGIVGVALLAEAVMFCDEGILLLVAEVEEVVGFLFLESTDFLCCFSSANANLAAVSSSSSYFKGKHLKTN
jgi:hypothetical protein